MHSIASEESVGELLKHREIRRRSLEIDRTARERGNRLRRRSLFTPSLGPLVVMSTSTVPGSASSLHHVSDYSSSLTSPVIVRPTTPNPAINPAASSKFIDRIHARIQAKQPFFSFEYFPPKTADGLTNLYMRFDRMGSLGPVRPPLLALPPPFRLPFFHQFAF